MSKKRLYSMAGGPWLFWIFAVVIGVGSLYAICFPGSPNGSGREAWWGWLLLSLGVCVLFILHSFGCLNLLEFSDEKLYHKNATYNWESVYITAIHNRKCCFVFSERFLSVDEAMKACKKGLYLTITTKKRLEYLLNKYQKEIYIPEPFVNKEIVIVKGQLTLTLKEINDRIDSHNHAIKLTQERMN